MANIITESVAKSREAILKFFPRVKNWKGSREINGEVINDGIKGPFDLGTTDGQVPKMPNDIDSRYYQPVSQDMRGQASKLVASINKTAKSRAEYVSLVDEIKGYALAEALVRDVSNDVMKKFYDKSLYPSYFQVIVNHEDVDNELVNELVSSFNIEELLREYITEILWYGEYTFKIDWDNLELDDIDYDHSLLSMYSRNKFKYVITPGSQSRASELLDSNSYLTFRVMSSNVNTHFKDESDANFFLRLSQGIFSTAAIGLMKTLKMLEELIPISEVNTISRKYLYTLKMPMGTSMSDAYDKCRKMEMVITSQSKSDKPPTSVSELLDQSTKVKVIPLFGDQSDATKQDLEKPEKIDLTYINDLRTQLANAISVPTQFIVPDAETSPASQTRYLRMLASIRDSLASSVKHLVYNYIKYGLFDGKSNSEIEYDMIEVITPRVQGVDELDAIEYVTLTSAAMKDMSDLIENCKSLVEAAMGDETKIVELDTLVKFVNNKVRPIVGADLFVIPPEDLGEDLADDEDTMSDGGDPGSYDDPGSDDSGSFYDEPSNTDDNPMTTDEPVKAGDDQPDLTQQDLPDEGVTMDDNGDVEIDPGMMK